LVRQLIQLTFYYHIRHRYFFHIFIRLDMYITGPSPKNKSKIGNIQKRLSLVNLILIEPFFVDQKFQQHIFLLIMSNTLITDIQEYI